MFTPTDCNRTDRIVIVVIELKNARYWREQVWHPDDILRTDQVIDRLNAELDRLTDERKVA